MLANAPSVFQFFTSLLFITVFIIGLRACLTWLLKINRVLMHLRAISEKLGVPAQTSIPTWSSRLLRAKRIVAKVPIVAANDAQCVCPCCGSMVSKVKLSDAQDRFVWPGRE